MPAPHLVASRGALAAAAHVLLAAAAQPPTAPATPPGPGTRTLGLARGGARRPCDGRYAMVTLTVRDAADRPVVAARLLSRLADSATLWAVQPQAQTDGEYLLADDSALRLLAGRDVALDVVITAAGRTHTVRQVLGPTRDGCHIARRAGDAVVTLR